VTGLIAQPLLFLKNVEQLAAVRTERPELVSGSDIVALSLGGWLALRERGVDARPASEFLEDGDLGDVVRAASALGREWYGPCRALLTYDGFDLGELVRLENLWFFWELGAAARVARRIVERRPPSHVFLFAGRGAPCLRSHRVRATHSVCEAALVDAFTTEGIPTTNLATIDRGRLPFVPLGLKRGLRRLLRGPAGSRPQACDASAGVRPGLPVRRPGTRLLLAIGEEVDLLSLAPVVHALDASPAYSAALVNSGGEILETSTRSGLTTVPADRALSLADAYPTHTPEATAARLDQARRDLDRSRRARPSAGATPFRSPLLDAHFDAVWAGLKDSVVPHIRRVTSLLRDTRPDGVIVAGCEMAKDRATVAVARRLGICTFAIPHGYVGNVAAFDFESDHFIAWGDASRECLVTELGKDAESIPVFGPLHLASIGPAEAAASPGTRRRLLALTSRISPACFEQVDPVTFERAWAAVVGFMAASADVELIVKPHGGGADVVDFYERLIASLPAGRARLERSRRLEDMAGEVDAVVAMIDPTTAILVAQLLGLPTVYVRAGWRDMPWAARAWGGPDGLTSVDDIGGIAPALERLVGDEAFRRDCLARGRALVERNLKPHGHDGPAKELAAIFDACFPGERPATDTVAAQPSTP
jgi:hypothetical protein